MKASVRLKQAFTVVYTSTWNKKLSHMKYGKEFKSRLSIPCVMPLRGTFSFSLEDLGTKLVKGVNESFTHSHAHTQQAK